MKTIEELEKLEKLINELFEILPKHYENNSDNSVCKNKCFSTHIKYPKTGNKETRISEQEAKQIFIQLLEREGYTYSVETPTLCHKYRFSGTIEENVPRIDDQNGQSGNIDVSIYKDITKDSPCEKFLCHIEFKANNPADHDIKKDILKLYKEATSSKTNYFIHVIKAADVNNVDKINSLFDKYRGCLQFCPNDRTISSLCSKYPSCCQCCPNDRTISSLCSKYPSCCQCCSNGSVKVCIVILDNHKSCIFDLKTIQNTLPPFV